MDSPPCEVEDPEEIRGRGVRGGQHPLSSPFVRGTTDAAQDIVGIQSTDLAITVLLVLRKEQVHRILQEFLQLLKETRGLRAVRYSMVDGNRRFHD
jgi:hypothetical protein